MLNVKFWLLVFLSFALLGSPTVRAENVIKGSPNTTTQPQPPSSAYPEPYPYPHEGGQYPSTGGGYPGAYPGSTPKEKRAEVAPVGNGAAFTFDRLAKLTPADFEGVKMIGYKGKSATDLMKFSPDDAKSFQVHVAAIRAYVEGLKKCTGPGHQSEALAVRLLEDYAREILTGVTVTGNLDAERLFAFTQVFERDFAQARQRRFIKESHLMETVDGAVRSSMDSIAFLGPRLSTVQGDMVVTRLYNADEPKFATLKAYSDALRAALAAPGAEACLPPTTP